MLLWIAVGGALGALARYGLAGWVHSWAGAAFPWGTFAVNGTGCLFIGFLLRWTESTAASHELRAFLTIGLLGAFTTFSTYSYETVALARTGEWARAGAYAAGSLAVGLVAVGAGLWAASLALHARS